MKKIIVIGTGHLADITHDKLADNGFEVKRIKSEVFQFDINTDIQEESLEYAKQRLKEAGVYEARALCLVDKTDGMNMHILLASMEMVPDLPTFVSVVDETLYHKVKEFDRTITVINPVAIAEPAFIEKLGKPERRWWFQNTSTKTGLPPLRKSHAARFMIGLILTTMVANIVFFMVTENLPLLQAYYYFVGEVTSFSFNDIAVSNYDPMVVFIRTTLLFATFGVVPIGIGIIAGTFWAHIMETHLTGKRRYRMRNHVIICGLGNLGIRLAEALHRKGIKVLAIETNVSSPAVDSARALDIPVMIADATLRYTLENANITKAAAIISAVNDDMQNLKIGLSARWFRPDLRVILRIFDEDTAKAICKRFEIQDAISMSDMASDKIVAGIEKIG